jgi:hypothetical protein
VEDDLCSACTKYWLIASKRKDRKKKFKVVVPAESRAAALNYANKALFASKYFPDPDSIKQVSVREYQLFIHTLANATSINDLEEGPPKKKKGGKHA